MEGDGIMGEIFESIQDEVKAKSRLLKAEKERVSCHTKKWRFDFNKDCLLLSLLFIFRMQV